MGDKQDFVDPISDATRQRWRHTGAARVREPAKAESPLGHWPPPRWAQWRAQLRKPWKSGDFDDSESN